MTKHFWNYAEVANFAKSGHTDPLQADRGFSKPAFFLFCELTYQ